jgi:hypothetical protein
MQEGFIKPKHRALLVADGNAGSLLDALHAAAQVSAESPH